MGEIKAQGKTMVSLNPPVCDFGLPAADFDLPKDFVHAQNANGRVAMGLHGYRTGAGEYGRVGMPMRPFHPICHGFLGWTPRQQGGFHLRRIGGDLYYPGAPIVPNRPDGRMKPGELQSGGYGFYYKYKAGQPVQPAQQADVLQNLQTVITPLVSRPRSTRCKGVWAFEMISRSQAAGQPAACKPLCSSAAVETPM